MLLMLKVAIFNGPGYPTLRSGSFDLNQRLAIRTALVAAPSRRLSPITVMQRVLPPASRSSVTHATDERAITIVHARKRAQTITTRTGKEA
jgi:hypothetical protein